MSVYGVRPKADGLSLIVEFEEKLGATRSAIIAAMLDYLAIYQRDEIRKFMTSDVVFFTKAYRIKKTKRPGDNK